MGKEQWVRLLHQRSSKKKKMEENKFFFKFIGDEKKFSVKNWKNGQSRERNPMREALQSSRLPLYLKNEYIYGPRVKWA